MSGENCNSNDICVLRVGKGERSELCFKTAYRNYVWECVNLLTSNEDNSGGTAPLTSKCYFIYLFNKYRY